MTLTLQELALIRPELGLTLGTDRGRQAGWAPAADAFAADGWAEIVQSYRARMGGAASHAAASCALQSHAGRVGGVAIWMWLLTQRREHARVWTPERDLVWLRYESGSARSITVAHPSYGEGTLEQLAQSLLDYLGDLIELCIREHRVPRRTAYGDVAAAFAGPFRRMAAVAAGQERFRVLSLADEFFAGSPWPYAGLIRFEESPDGTLGYGRGVCCLIYKSSSGHRCASCCLHPPDWRADQWRLLD